MSNTSKKQSSFLSKLDERIAINLNNEQFGVEELAGEMGMSRSNLHRKLQKETGKSISRYIREYRLQKAYELLLKGNKNANEVAHTVGFGSASYFSKSFSEYFGYSPTKIPGPSVTVPLWDKAKNRRRIKKSKLIWAFGTSMFFIALALFFLFKTNSSSNTDNTAIKRPLYIMPIKNLSENEGNAYLAEGIQNALNRHFMTIEEIDLLSPYAFDPTVQEASLMKMIGRQNDHILVLMGSLQRYGDDLRMEFRLESPNTGQQLWAKKYDRKAEDLLAVQEEVASNVVAVFKGKGVSLSENQAERELRPTKYDPVAYDYYLKSWYYVNDFTATSQQQAFKYAQIALEIDSTLAPAHDILAVVYLGMATASISKSDATHAFKLAEPHIKKAMTLDPTFPAVYGTAGFMELYKNWDFEASERSYDKGFDYSNDPLLHFTYVNLLLIENRFEEALEAASFCEIRYPFYPISAMILPYYFNGDITSAKRIIEEKLFKHPNNYFVQEVAAFLTLNTGLLDNTLQHCEKILELTQNRTPKILGFMGAAQAHKGNIEIAKELLNELIERKKESDAGAPAFYAGVIATALGEHETALDWLERAVGDHEMEVPWLVNEPQLYPLHGHPRFDALVDKVEFRAHAYPVQDSIVKERIAAVSPYVSAE